MKTMSALAGRLAILGALVASGGSIALGQIATPNPVLNRELQTESGRKEKLQAIAAEAKALTARAEKLVDAVASQPDKTIPEMDLLTPRDWLLVAKDASFASELEIRSTLSKLRKTAKDRFADLLSDSLTAYTQAHGGRLPNEAIELAPFIGTPVFQAAIGRYRQNYRGPAKDVPKGKWIFEERAPVDDWFEDLVMIGPPGMRGSQTIRSDQAAVMTAIDAYTKAKGRHPATADELAPYLRQSISAKRIAEIFMTAGAEIRSGSN